MMIDREKTIQNIEAMFFYMGCANLDTSSMDGAIPLDSLAITDSNAALGVLKENPVKSGLPWDWQLKAAYFSNEKLNLMTCVGLHWSRVSPTFSRAVNFYRNTGGMKAPDYDCYNHLYYSRINKDGKFEKFRCDEREGRVGLNLKATRLFNPRWLLAYAGDTCHHLTGSSAELGKKLDVVTGNCLLASIAVGMNYHWCAKVSIEKDIPSLTVITDPTGVKELWKLRDIPEGKKRREALLHWVASHWRQNRKDPEVEHYVRKQLRGQTLFQHGSLSVEIKPSSTDELEVEMAKIDRAELKVKQQDRRKRHKVLQAKHRR